MKIRVLIVDDEAPARARLRQLLQPEPDLEIIGECMSGRQALETIRRDKPDLVFLDILMPRLTGLDVCARLKRDGIPLPCIIFCTAYDQYALKAFEVHAIDYVLKPCDPERLQEALHHARSRLRRAQPALAEQRLSELLDSLRQGVQQEDRLVLKQDGRVIFVRPASIDWLEADGNYVRVHCGTEAYYVRETLASFEGQLPTAKFMRVSRSAVVNVDRIKEFQPLFYGDYTVLLQSGVKVTLSRNYRDRLEKLLEKRS
jgi:two-component system, LytTR family, response regulator